MQKSGGKDGALAGDCKECGKTVKAQQNSGGERTGELPGGSRIGGELDVVLLPYENERGMAATREVMERIAPGQSVGIFIGPEGGFDPSEIALAKEEGMHLVSLGKRILRTETAGLATLSILMYHIESVSEAEEERDQP